MRTTSLVLNRARGMVQRNFISRSSVRSLATGTQALLSQPVCEEDLGDRFVLTQMRAAGGI
jgi:hypothetical protein